MDGRDTSAMKAQDGGIVGAVLPTLMEVKGDGADADGEGDDTEPRVNGAITGPRAICYS